jgi:hypothetical protein
MYTISEQTRLQPITCPHCQKPTILIWTNNADPTTTPVCSQCAELVDSLFNLDNMTLYVTPLLSQSTEGPWSVSANPALDFASLRQYLDWCVEPDPPIDRQLLVTDIGNLVGVFKIMRTMAANNVQERAVRRIGGVLKELALGRRIIATHRLPWRFLPRGKTGIRRAVNYFRRVRQLLPELKIDEERLTFMESLPADETYLGQDSFEGYICFYFTDKQVAVLECPIYGNAVYILKQDWQSLSRYSKTELLTYFSDSIVCIRHTSRFDWHLKRELSKLGITI